MNRIQLLLGKLAEEAAEVAQIALKSQHFGLEEVYPKKGISNGKRLALELGDMAAIMEMLTEEDVDINDIDIGIDEHIKKKREKVEDFLEYSISLGMVDPSASRKNQ